MTRPSDLVQGTLELLLLKILALQPLHGVAISDRLRQVSGDRLHVSDGSLYPALHKLEQRLAHIRENLNTKELAVEFERAHHLRKIPPAKKK